MAVKVCKFGGTSMADGNVINRVKNIIFADKERKYIVVSAPGKRYSKDTKVTDLLYAVAAELKEKGNIDESFKLVKARFESIVRELNISFDIDSVLADTKERILKEGTEDFIASRGEYLSAVVVARVLNAKFIDAEDVVFFNADGTLDESATNKAIVNATKDNSLYVFPGFYGKGADGKVKTFSRGGSDISGAVVARAVNAALYENWTDVSGFFACDPRIVDSPKKIKYLSYKELRELSYMGANVLHSESIFPVRKANIPIRILNTFSPEDDGTEIIPTSRYIPSGDIVTGIAGRKDFTVIFIEKSLMNSEVGFMYSVLKVLFDAGVSVEHVPSGIDTMSLVIDSHQLTEEKLASIVENIKKAVNPDVIRTIENVALIATVGHGMSSSVGTGGRLLGAIAQAGVNIGMIDQGSSEMNIIVAVKNDDYLKCIQAIYKEFFR